MLHRPRIYLWLKEKNRFTKFMTNNVSMTRNVIWNILSMPVLGNNWSGVILMVFVSDVRNVDWELNMGDYHTTLFLISRPRNSCWLV